MHSFYGEIAYKTPPDSVMEPLTEVLGIFLFIIFSVGVGVLIWAGGWLWVDRENSVTSDSAAQRRRVMSALFGGIIASSASAIAWMVLT